jgi:Secretion system C-terminal sorting domain
LDFYLDPTSVIEYNAASLQSVTGLSNTIATGAQHQYGILSINNTGSAVTDEAKLTQATVTVRTKLILQNGRLRLNGNSLTILNSSASAIERMLGYLKAESVNDKVIWKNISAGNYTLPFGESPTDYVPFLFSPTNGSGDAVFTSYRTGTSNSPIPTSAGSILLDGVDVANSAAMDRWYIVTAPGIKANATFTIIKTENTTGGVAGDALGVISYQDQAWKTIACNAVLTSTNSSSVNATALNGTGTYLVVLKKEWKQNYFDLSGILSDKKVVLNWSLGNDVEGSEFEIERSTDQNNFMTLKSISSNGSGIYVEEDEDPLSGLSYYRIKSTDVTGKINYSTVIKISDERVIGNDFSIQSVGPNPFDDFVNINYFSHNEFTATVSLVSTNGKLIASSREVFAAGNNIYTYRQQQYLQSGIYMLTVSSKYGARTFKVIKK